MAKFSKAERVVVEWLQPLQVVLNDRKFFGTEVDIYVPKHQLAIEIDDPAWHTEFHGRGEMFHHDKYLSVAKKNCRFLKFEVQDINNRPEVVKAILNREIARCNVISEKICKPSKESAEVMRQFVKDNTLETLSVDDAFFLGLEDKLGLAMVVYGHYCYDLEYPNKCLIIHGVAERSGVHILMGLPRLMKDIAKAFNLNHTLFIYKNGTQTIYSGELAAASCREIKTYAPCYTWVKNKQVFSDSQLQDKTGFARMFDYGTSRMKLINRKGSVTSLETDQLPFKDYYEPTK